MSRRVKRIDETRSYASVTKEEKRTISYSWANSDGSGEVYSHQNLLALAMHIDRSLLEARVYALRAGCFDNGADIDIIICTHSWLGGDTRPYVLSIEPPDKEENDRLYASNTFEESSDRFSDELDTLINHRKGRIYSIEDVLGYP